MADGIRRLLRWLVVTGGVILLGVLTAPSLPVPPVLHPDRIPDWWGQSGPIAGAGSVLRLAVLITAGAWLLCDAAAGASGTARCCSRGWTRIRSTPGLVRLALGLTTSGGVLGACGSASHATSEQATVPVAPVLVGPTASAPVAPPWSVENPAPVATAQAPNPKKVTATSPAPAPTRPLAQRRPSRPVSRATSAVAETEPAMWTVRPGDDFWSIAEHVVSGQSAHPTGEREVAGYWARLIATNRGREPRPGDPDLLFPGQVLVLPPL